MCILSVVYDIHYDNIKKATISDIPFIVIETVKSFGHAYRIYNEQYT